MQGADSCPHCNVVADVEPHAALGFRCLVCGGPRVVVDAPQVKLSPAAREPLKTARRGHTRHLLFTAGGLALLGVGGLALLLSGLVLLAASPGPLLTGLTLLGCSLPLLAGTWAMTRAAAARKLRGEALHAARLAALEDAQAALGQLDAERVSQLMRIDAEQAELLLAEASVASMLEPAAPRLRIDAGPTETEQADPSNEAAEAAAATANARVPR